MAATTVRGYVADAIQEAAPTWKVHPYPYTPDNVARGKPVVSVYRSDVGPGTTDLNITHDVVVNIYGAMTSNSALEEELEGTLDTVQVALQGLTQYSWAKSSRIWWRDGTITGWQITGTVTTENVYRNALIRNEE